MKPSPPYRPLDVIAVLRRWGAAAILLAGVPIQGEAAPAAGFQPGDVHDVTFVRLLKDESRRYDQVWEPYIASWTNPGMDDPPLRPQTDPVPTYGPRNALLVAFGRRLAGKVDMGDIVCARSLDGGKTWSEPVTVFDSNLPNGTQRFAYANAILFRPEHQNLVWCYAMRCPHAYTDSEDSSLCAAYSADGGLTWTPVELAVHYHQPLIVVAGILPVQVGGRTRYLFPAQRNSRRHDPRGDTQQFVLESDDLIEWRLAGYVPQPEPAQIFLHEASIAPGEHAGELKMVMRTAHLDGHVPLDPPRAYSTTSTDFGHTWSEARAEPALYNAISKGYYGTLSRGRHIYVYSAGPVGERKVLKYVVQDSAGHWSEPRVFFDGGTRNSYPTLLEESPGHYWAVWDSSTDAVLARTAIRFGRIDLP